MPFMLGARSRAKLARAHPRLRLVIERGIVLTRQDFTVWETTRSEAAQRDNIRAGTSWTMASKHLKRPAEAADLVPWIGGEPVWDWDGCYAIAVAIRDAARELDTPLIWGGCWDRILNDIEDPKAASLDYVARRRRARKRAAVDGPHYELA